MEMVVAPETWLGEQPITGDILFLVEKKQPTIYVLLRLVQCSAVCIFGGLTTLLCSGVLENVFLKRQYFTISK